MTGWRIGYCGGPALLINAMTKIKGQTTSVGGHKITSNTVSIILICIVLLLPVVRMQMGRIDPKLD
jgi:hypothetical protein